MKKLMIAAAIVCAAALAQATTIKWGSGAFFTAKDSTGGWSSTGVQNTNPKTDVLMSVYLVDSDTYASLSGKDQAGLYEWAQTQTATYTGVNKNTSGTVIAAVNIQKDLAASTTYYTILTAEYTDATYGDMYMAKADTFTSAASGSQSISNIFGGAGTASAGGIRNWQAVPEPTSGLLLLLGVAGLALRRRRA